MMKRARVKTPCCSVLMQYDIHHMTSANSSTPTPWTHVIKHDVTWHDMNVLYLSQWTSLFSESVILVIVMESISPSESVHRSEDCRTRLQIKLNSIISHLIKSHHVTSHWITLHHIKSHYIESNHLTLNQCLWMSNVPLKFNAVSSLFKTSLSIRHSTTCMHDNKHWQHLH